MSNPSCKTSTTKTRILALLTAGLVTFTACGGASTDAVVTDPTPTVAAPAMESNDPQPEPTPAPEPTAEPVAEPTAEPAPTPEPTAEPVANPISATGLELSIADDVVMNADLSRDEVLAVATAAMGPTDDLEASIARIDSAFQADLPTLPDTDVIRVTWRTKVDDVGGEGQYTFHDMNFDFVSSASREDAALTFLTELAAAGWDTDSGEQSKDAIVFSTISADRPDNNGTLGRTMRISFTDRVEGGSIGSVTFSNSGLEDLSGALINEGWHQDSPVPANATFYRFSGQVSPNNNGNYYTSLFSAYDVDDVSLADAIGQVEEGTNGSDWELNDDAILGEESQSVQFEGERSSISINEKGDGSAVEFSTQVEVRATTPIPEATQGTGVETGTGTETTEPVSGPGAAGTFATANATAIDASMDNAAIEEVLLSMLGETDDLAGTLARVIQFPAGVSTLPDTFIENVRVDLGQTSPSAPGDATTVDNVVRVDFFTSTSAEDAVLAYQTELVGLGWELDRSGTDENNGLLYHWADLQDPTAPGSTFLAIRAVELDNGTVSVDIDYTDRGRTDLESINDANGWSGEAPFPAGGVHMSTELYVAFLNPTLISLDMYSVERFWDVTEDDAKAAALEELAGPDWTFVEDRDTTVTLDFKGNRGSTYFNSRDASDDRAGYTDQTVTYSTTVDVN